MDVRRARILSLRLLFLVIFGAMYRFRIVYRPVDNEDVRPGDNKDVILFNWNNSTMFDLSEQRPFDAPICPVESTPCMQSVICQHLDSSDKQTNVYNSLKRFTNDKRKRCRNFKLLEDVTKWIPQDQLIRMKLLLVAMPVVDISQMYHAALQGVCSAITDAHLLLVSAHRIDTGDPRLHQMFKCFLRVDALQFTSHTSSLNQLNEIDHLKAFLTQTSKVSSHFRFVTWFGFETMKQLPDLWLDAIIDILPVEGHILLKFDLPLSKKSPFYDDSNGMQADLNYGLFNPVIMSSWNSGFMRLVKGIVFTGAELVPKQDLQTLLGWALFNDACTFKTLSFAIQYHEVISLSSSRPDSHQASSELNPCRQVLNSAVKAIQTALVGSDKEQKAIAKMLVEKLSVGARVVAAAMDDPRENVTRSHHQFCQLAAPRLLQDFSAGSHPPNAIDTGELIHDHMQHRNAKRPLTKLLVAMVFCGKQIKELFRAIERWKNENIRPCHHGNQQFGLLFVQSDPDIKNSTKPDTMAFLKEHRDAVKCFSTIEFRFVQVPFDGYHAGPAQMFKEIILGDVAAGFDHVFQMEPDIYPIRPLWLHTLAKEATGDFWVKGSTALYFDHWEPDAAFISTSRPENDSVVFGPVGYRILHINGNALYSLSREFRGIVRDFFSSAEGTMSEALGFPCERRNRMACKEGLCHGSFDTTLTEYLLATVPISELLRTRYRNSPFVLNGLNGHIPASRLPEDTVFIHKPWRLDYGKFFKGVEHSDLRAELEQLEDRIRFKEQIKKIKNDFEHSSVSRLVDFDALVKSAT